MIDFTEEHEQFRSSVQRFIASEINPHVDAWEAAGRFPAHEVFRKMGELGYLGVYKPDRWGGADEVMLRIISRQMGIAPGEKRA